MSRVLECVGGPLDGRFVKVEGDQQRFVVHRLMPAQGAGYADEPPSVAVVETHSGYYFVRLKPHDPDGWPCLWWRQVDVEV